MVEYKIVLTKTAQKQLDKLPDSTAEMLLDVIERLADNPRPDGCKKLKGRSGYRVGRATIELFTTFKTIF